MTTKRVLINGQHQLAALNAAVAAASAAASAGKIPSIADAKALAHRFRRRGVIVLTFGDGDYSAASYGMTRHDCDEMRRVVEQFARLVEVRAIRVPRAKEPG